MIYSIQDIILDYRLTYFDGKMLELLLDTKSMNTDKHSNYNEIKRLSDIIASNPKAYNLMRQSCKKYRPWKISQDDIIKGYNLDEDESELLRLCLSSWKSQTARRKKIHNICIRLTNRLYESTKA